MTSLAMMPAPAGSRLDYALLRRASAGLAVLAVCLSPLSQDMAACALGGIVPWVILTLIGTPGMPAALTYLFLWQWMQVYARLLQSVVDGEALGAGLYGADTVLAYWYMLASLVVMAIPFRLICGSLRPPTAAEFSAHERWRPADMILVFIAAVVISVVMSFAARAVPALNQPFEVASRVKLVALFILCAYTLTTGKGAKFTLGAILVEIINGFTGFFSDFRAVFIYLAVAAIASRIRWSAVTSFIALAWIMLLVGLALFWTAVKMDYRVFASQSDESQAIQVPLGERFAYLGSKLATPDAINWGDAAYTLLIRFAYVDIFGAVINVATTSPEVEPHRQWTEAFQHVFQPRFLFPDKPELSDSEVYVRLAQLNPMEQVRAGTSISVGYMAENFADFGFPGMLGGIFAMGVMMALIVRYFMRRDLPWMMREAIIMGFAISISRDGVEVSLPKVLGGMFMFMIVFALLSRFVFPVVIRWLEKRASTATQMRRG